MTTSIPSSPIEFLEAQRLAEAKEKGFAFFIIRPEENLPGFAYSIGMAQHDLPELLCYFNTEEMGVSTLGLMHNLCTTLIESTSRFGRIPTLKAFCNRTIGATDPEVIYTPKFHTGDTYMYLLKTVLTRAVMFRKELGIPQVIELQHSDVPTVDGIRAELMLQNS
jgi:hypothetical protein